MIQVDLGERFDAAGGNASIVELMQLSEFLDDKLNEASQVVVVVNEYLQKVFDAYALVLTQLKALELFERELLLVRIVVNQRLHDLLQNANHLIVQCGCFGCLLDAR